MNKKQTSRASEILIEATGCGPFDGGCLIFAKGLLQVFPGSDLATMVRADKSNYDGQAEHYGIRLADGGYVDASGIFRSKKAWVKKFSSLESVDFPMEVVDRFVPSDIQDEAWLSKKIAQVFLKRGGQDA